MEKSECTSEEGKVDILVKLEVILNQIDLSNLRESLEFRLLHLAEDFILNEYEAAWQALTPDHSASVYRAELLSKLGDQRKRQEH